MPNNKRYGESFADPVVPYLFCLPFVQRASFFVCFAVLLLIEEEEKQ
jgi:hypothetical protein